MADFDRARPPVFVDAVGLLDFRYEDNRDEFAHEHYPELRERIANNYVLMDEVDGSRGVCFAATGRLAFARPLRDREVTVPIKPLATNGVVWHGPGPPAAPGRTPPSC